ncbi:hypothetical protein L2E82_30251 [Cichorium intybus]|uniref:Uncharacterized protein n=1 Tax=Cichorium intybus TaxID=13427 RepID=A0ACB9CZT7_CICIN|nr:hypothetical protein L2E82_30251 [Cichorium intybus]
MHRLHRRPDPGWSDSDWGESPGSSVLRSRETHGYLHRGGSPKPTLHVRGRPGRASSATRFTGSCTVSSPPLLCRGRAREGVL